MPRVISTGRCCPRCCQAGRDDDGRAPAALRGLHRARSQILAGAIVAEAAMDLLGVERLEICPWALREGVILRRLDRML